MLCIKFIIYIKNKYIINPCAIKHTYNSPFPSSPEPLFQSEGRCSAFDMEIIFHSHANKAHFHKKEGLSGVNR